MRQLNYMIAQIVLASVFAVVASGQADGTGAAEIAPKLIHRGLTTIPLAVFQERIEGSVILEAKITTRGKVADIKVRKSVHPLLDKAAIEDLRRWRYSPGTLNGKARVTGRKLESARGAHLDCDRPGQSCLPVPHHNI